MMNERFAEIWVYLSTTPLVWLSITLLAYQAAIWVSQRCRHHPLANPVLLAVAFLVSALLLSHTPYQTYFDGAKFVHFLLGPATVALAIPLHAQFHRLVRLVWPLTLALICGALTASVSAVLIAKLFGASPVTLMSLAPKSVTSPIAMGISERIGGLPSLTSVMVIFTGVIGSVGAQSVFSLLRCRDSVTRGFSLGLASHGIGTARAFQSDQQAGAFAALAMGLNGLLSAVLLPWIMPWLMRLLA